MIQADQAEADGGHSTTQAILSDIRIAPVAVNGSSPPAPTGTITLNAPAPAGGLVVNLTTDRPALVSVPAKPLIPEGAVATFFEPLITPADAPTRALITASVGRESTSTEIEILPRPTADGTTPTNAEAKQTMAADELKGQLVSMPTQTDVAGPTETNGVAAMVKESAVAITPTPPAIVTVAPSSPPTTDDRIKHVLAQLATARLSTEEQAEVAGLVRVLDGAVSQHMDALLGEVELATALLVADPPQVAAVSAIRANLEKKLNERSLIAFLRRNSSIGNVALGLASLVVVATAIVAWVAANLKPGTTIASMDATLLVLISVAGALGGVISVMYRIDGFNDTSEAGPLRLYFTGLLKPIMGVGFALFVFVALNAKVTTLIQPAPNTEPYFYAALGFIAGFVEQFAPDLINKAESTVEGGSGSTSNPSVSGK
jgi:hypothetical protein